MGLDIILVTMLILLGVCKAAAINTRNDTLLGLCLQDDSHCTELGPNETCRSRGNEQAERYNTGICRYEQTIQTSTCKYKPGASPESLEEALCPQASECEPEPNAVWPVMNYTLIHDNNNPEFFIVDIRWQEVNVSGYSITVSLRQWSCPVGEVYLQCGTTDLTSGSNGFLYTHIRGYHQNEQSKDGQLFIKLTPHGWCDGPQLSLDIPEACYSLCPGACSVCEEDESDPALPTELSVSLCWSPVSNMSTATVAWQSNRTYYSAYPNQTYYAAVFRDNKIVSRHIEIVGRTNVTLHNLSLNHSHKYVIKVWPFDCRCGHISVQKEFSLGSTSTPLCPGYATTTTRTSFTTNPTSTHISLHTSSPTLTLSTTLTPTHISLHTSSPTLTLSTSSPTLTLSTSSPTLTLSTTLTPSQTIPFPSSTPFTSFTDWLYLLLFFVIAASVTFFIIVIIIYRFRYQNSRLPFNDSTNSPSLTPQPLTTNVLLVYSLRTSTEDIENILANFAVPLQLYGIQVIFYDMLCGQVGIPQWMENAVTQSSKVFLVCNNEFKTEWEDPSVSPLEGNLVHILKQNFFAHVRTSSDYMSKYALLFMSSRESEKCIASSYLLNLQRFVVDPVDPSRLDQVARFITNTKSYILDMGD